MSFLQNFNYLKYIIKHKYFVFVAGRKIGCPLWRLVVHDMSKFLPSEWVPYRDTFYDVSGLTRYKPRTDFHLAWLKHQHRNKHHWQYWLLTMDNEKPKRIDMPTEYVYEMVADWMGAGRTITGKWDVCDWYETNKDNIKISESVKESVEYILKGLKGDPDWPRE